MEDKNYLLEAFKAFDDLNEEIFDISINDGLEKAKEYKDEIVDEIDDSEIVIDPLAADEEEIEDTYVGKAILKCSICQSMLYKDPEEVIVDDEVELANVGEACPYCQSEDGYYVIGQVEEFCDDECEHDKDDHDEDKDDEEDLHESYKVIDKNGNKVRQGGGFKTKEEAELFAAQYGEKNLKVVKESLKEDWDYADDYLVTVYEDGESKIEALDEYEAEAQFAEIRDMSDDELIGKGLLGAGHLWMDDQGLVQILEITFIDGKRDIVEKVMQSYIQSGLDESIKTRKKVRTENLDDIDADTDDKKERAKKVFARKKDDADADRDYKLKKRGLKESKRLNETGEWEDDDEGIAWKQGLSELVKKYTDGIEEFSFDEDDIYGFDKYQGPYIDTEIGTIWSHPEGTIDSFVVECGNALYEISSREDAEDLVSGRLRPIHIQESCNRRIKKSKSLKESDKPAATSIEDAQKWVDYDMKKYGKISARTNRLIKKAGFQIIKDNHGDYEVTAGKFESMKEDFERVDIETDRERMSMSSDENGKVTVTTEPKENVEAEVEEKEEVIEPVSDEIKAKFKTSDDEAVDYDFDEFEESDFDELGESYLKRVYENVKSFKTTKGAINGNNLKLEGLITFKSGKQVKTNFVFESYKATKTGKLKFIGENKQFAKGKKSFTLSARADGKKLCCESLTYNYRAKSPDGASKRLYGTVKR